MKALDTIRILTLGALMVIMVGCASVTLESTTATLPTIPAGHGRLFFLGGNQHWYGLLAGGMYAPNIVIDGKTVEHGHGRHVYFYADTLAGPHTVWMDDPGFAGYVPRVDIELAEEQTVYVHMQMRPTPSKFLSLRTNDFYLVLSVVTEDQARAVLGAGWGWRNAMKE